MDGLEKAIRAALAKGDASDRAYREKVYRSAFAALDRSLDNAAASEDARDSRRAALQAAVAEVEREHLHSETQGLEPSFDEPAVFDPPAAPDVVLDQPRAAPVVEPRIDHTPAPAGERREPQLQVSPDWGDEYRIDADLDESIPGETRDIRRRRSPAALLFVTVTLLAFLALGWWLWNSGFLMSAADRDTSVPNPSPVAEEEGFIPEGTAPASQAPSTMPQADSADPDAIDIFVASAETQVSAPGDATAETVEGGGGTHLRIRSGTSGSAIVFDMPRETLEQLAGQRAVFIISARAEEGEATQFSVTCSFGEMGDCGRQRYEAGYERSDFIFDVDLPEVAPGADGTIAVVSDVANEGKALDIFAIRVSAQ